MIDRIESTASQQSTHESSDSQRPLNISEEEAREFPEARRRWLTIPNSLCFLRFAGSFGLLAIAFVGQSEWFAWVFLVLALTDWVDGKLAVWLDQRSIYGTRLDSIADVSMYAALLIGGVILEWERLAREWPWIALAVGSYGCAALYGFGKFKSLPSYHTRTAKTSWLLVTVGALCLLLDVSVWPFRIALIAVTIGNLESLAITHVSDRQRFNVKSLYHVLRE